MALAMTGNGHHFITVEVRPISYVQVSVAAPLANILRFFSQMKATGGAAVFLVTEQSTTFCTPA
jgi:hypothetical protein